MFSTIVRIGLVALVAAAYAATPAEAGTSYDGRWSLTIQTTHGDCSTYDLPVDIGNGRVSFPGLVKAKGRVTGKGSVRVFVSATGKSAAGSGRLTGSFGSGRWSGRSSEGRCSGVWTARRA
jgi:hypothetical protein